MQSLHQLTAATWRSTKLGTGLADVSSSIRLALCGGFVRPVPEAHQALVRSLFQFRTIASGVLSVDLLRRKSRTGRLSEDKDNNNKEIPLVA